MSAVSDSGPGQHAPGNAMGDPGEIARYRDRASELMRLLLDALAVAPGQPRTLPQIERELGWPPRRIASVLGGAGRLRLTEFAGRRPYRFREPAQASSGRWEMWMDTVQADAIRAAREDDGGNPAERRAQAWTPATRGTNPA